MKKFSSIVIILLLIVTILSNGLTFAKNTNLSTSEKLIVNPEGFVEIKQFTPKNVNSNNISFDIKIREQGGEWTDENVTIYVGSILEFKLDIETNRGYPLSLSAVVSLPASENGSLFEYIKNSEYSSKKTTLFNASDEDIVFLWFPVLRPTSITCRFQVKVQNEGSAKKIRGSAIGLIDENTADITNDSLFITSLIPPIPNTPKKPNGPMEGFVHDSFTFNASTTDPYDLSLSYRFSWGDGTYSDWIGPVSSGLAVYTNHSWNNPGTYPVRVKAKNQQNFESDWSEPLVISISEKIKLTSPEQGLYVKGSKIFNLPATLLIGQIKVTITTPGFNEVSYVEFFVNNKLKETRDTKPFTWTWDESFFGKYTLKVIVYDPLENSEEVVQRGFKIF